MAFPISPSDGDLYNGYEYNSTLSAWKKREVKDWVLVYDGGAADVVTNTWGLGLFRFHVTYNSSLDGGMTLVMHVENSTLSYYSPLFIGSTVSDKVGVEYSASNTRFLPVTTGDYASGQILRIWKWE